MSKTNLDKLFQKKLKDFSDIPDEKVWQAIEATLDEKEKSRRVIPIWWKLGGIAAALLIGLFLITTFNETPASPAVTNVNEASKEILEEKVTPKNTERVLEVPTTNEIQIAEKEKESLKSKTKNAPLEQIVNTSTKKTPSSASKKGAQPAVIKNAGTKIQLTENKKQKALQEKDTFDASTVKNNLHINTNSKEALAATETEAEKNTLAKKETNSHDGILNNNNNTRNNEGIAAVTKENLDTETTHKDPKKKSIFDEIAAQEKEKEEALAENKTNKWSAGPSVAPVYFNAIGEGSPVNAAFVPNSKSGDLNLSYGLSVAYEVSKKISVRSGIHKVDYGYNTEDITFSASTNARDFNNLSTIDYTPFSENIVVNSNLNTQENVAVDPFSEVSTSDNAALNGVMEQQFGYVEVPVELHYALIEKRFGINLIGGVSTLFLVDNSISLSSGELTTEVGKANNLNDVNFSTNVGFGMNYQFTPKIKLSVEPLFKYQLNTFSQTEGVFQPFSIGVYSGFSFKF